MAFLGQRSKYGLLFLFLAGSSLSHSFGDEEERSLLFKIDVHVVAKKAYWSLFTGVSFAAAGLALQRCGDVCDAADYWGAGACALGGALPWVDDFFNSRVQDIGTQLAALPRLMDKKED